MKIMIHFEEMEIKLFRYSIQEIIYLERTQSFLKKNFFTFLTARTCVHKRVRNISFLVNLPAH